MKTRKINKTIRTINIMIGIPDDKFKKLKTKYPNWYIILVDHIDKIIGE